MQGGEKMVKTRITWVDLAKGIGIILIVFGHIANVWESKVTWWLYSFHVPLFFLLSGITFNPQKSAKAFFTKNICKLVTAYLAFAFLSLLVFSIGGCIAPQLRQILDLNLYHNLKSILWGNSKNNTILNSPLWFLSCLVATYIQMYLVENLYIKKRQAKRVIVLATYLVIAFALYGKIKIAFWPWHLETSILIMPFFIAGKIMGDANVNSNIFSNVKKALACILAGLAGTWLAFLNTRFNLRQDECGNLLLFYLTGALLSLSVVLICQIVNKSQMLEYLGKHTLFVLGLHRFVLWGAEQIPVLNMLCQSGDTLQGLLARAALTAVDISLCMLVEKLWTKCRTYRWVRSKQQ